MERYVPEFDAGGARCAGESPNWLPSGWSPGTRDFGLFGIVTEFDDGETYSEPWGSREDTELAVHIRMQDIRRTVK